MAQFDRYFKDCGLTGPLYRDEMWIAVPGGHLKIPRRTFQSALFLLGYPGEPERSWFEDSDAWVFIVDDIEEFDWTLPRRLGVEPSLAGALAFPSGWEALSRLVSLKEVHDAIVVFDSSLVPEVRTSKELAKLRNLVSNNQNISCSFTGICSTDEIVRLSDVPCRWFAFNLLDFPGESHVRWSNFLRSWSQTSSVMTAGGSLDKWLSNWMAGLRRSPHPYFLEELAGNRAVTHASGYTVDLVDGQLFISGFVGRDGFPAHKWTANKVFVSFLDAERLLKRISLGCLRRPVLNMLPLNVGVSENSFAAFTVPGHEGVDVREFPSGAIVIRVGTVDGYQIEHCKIGPNRTWRDGDGLCFELSAVDDEVVLLVSSS